MASPDLSGYVPVVERLQRALAAYPELRIVEQPARVVELGDRLFVVASVTVFRSPDDPLPTTAEAWEPFPGRTPYTRDSEAANAATSALGRALGYMGYGLTVSIASADEIRARTDTPADSPPKPARSTPPRRPTGPGPQPAPSDDPTKIPPGMLRVIEAKAKRMGVAVPELGDRDEATEWLNRHNGFDGDVQS